MKSYITFSDAQELLKTKYWVEFTEPFHHDVLRNLKQQAETYDPMRMSDVISLVSKQSGDLILHPNIVSWDIRRAITFVLKNMWISDDDVSRFFEDINPITSTCQ